MDYRELGRSGVKVSALCLGTMTFGEQNSEAEGHAQLDYAFGRGINFVDAAEIYPVGPSPRRKVAARRSSALGWPRDGGATKW
jgi:aryl-alcohol dehydrogenase-like predicted oxidoreductase